MKIECFQIEHNGALTRDDPDGCLERWRGGEGRYWVDIECSEPEERTRWLSALNLSPLALRCSQEIGKNTRIVPLGNEVFLEFSVFCGDKNSQRTSLAFLCLNNLVITLHGKPIDNLRKVQSNLEEIQLSAATTAVVVYAISLGQSAQTARLAHENTARVDALDARMDQDPDSVEIDEILDQKAAVLLLDAVTSEQVACFDVLGEIKGKVLDMSALGDYLRYLTAEAQYSDRVVDRLDRRVADLRQRYEVNQQEKLNGRLAVLTVISAIFLPLSLITGIFGMNFDRMPELHYTYSYPIALGGMILLALGLLRVFYKRDWLGR